MSSDSWPLHTVCGAAAGKHDVQCTRGANRAYPAAPRLHTLVFCSCAAKVAAASKGDAAFMTASWCCCRLEDDDRQAHVRLQIQGSATTSSNHRFTASSSCYQPSVVQRRPYGEAIWGCEGTERARCGHFAGHTLYFNVTGPDEST